MIIACKYYLYRSGCVDAWKYEVPYWTKWQLLRGKFGVQFWFSKVSILYTMKGSI